MKVSPLAGSRELLILIRGCDRIPMCIQLPLPLHGRIYTGGRLFTIGPSSTAVKLSFLSGYLAVQREILMRDSLCSCDMDALRSNSFIFSRSVGFDWRILNRLTLAAGHDRAGAGRLRRDDNAAVVLQRNKDQWEQEFCLVQGVTSFLRDGAGLLKMEVLSLAGSSYSVGSPRSKRYAGSPT